MLRTVARHLLLPLLLGAVLAPPARAFGFDAVFSKDGVDVWAVGGAGGYDRSFDGGATWTTGTLAPAVDLHGVAARGLTVLVAGAGGRVWRSADNGGSWSLQVVAGGADLRAVVFRADGKAFAVGDDGRIQRSDDDGQSWSATGPAGAALYAIDFTDNLTGYAVGAGGRVLRTTDGGAVWNPLAVPTSRDLLAVDSFGATVWAVGRSATALRSIDGGAAWSAIDLRLEPRGDVRGVSLASATAVTLTGGGGFIRTSGDGGATWSFAVHPLFLPPAGYFAYDAARAWVVTRDASVVLRTADGGATWLPGDGTVISQYWTLQQAGPPVTVRGDTFCGTPQNPNSFWCVMGSLVYKTVDRGETWAAIDTIPAVIKTNSFYVSPRDSNLWVAAVGTPDRIARTTNAGVTWDAPFLRDFSEYGMPLEMNPDHPDTLLFGPEDGTLYRSLDFGASWDSLSHPAFRSPCDIVITPDANANILVGDGVTNQGLAKIWQSVDGGLLFSDRYTGISSETPTLWTSRLGNTTVFATNWSSGGVWRSLDSGASWAQVSTASSAWGGATAADDPRAVFFSRYAGTPNYVSTDGGSTFATVNLSSAGSGYALFAPDRATVLDMHSSGIWKFRNVYAMPTTTLQAVALLGPDGGESWPAGSVHAITWSATNLALVRIEYQVAPAAPWLPVALVEGGAGSYAWTVPDVSTNQARVRVSDAWDGSPADSSTGTFTIVGTGITLLAPDGGEAWQYGQSHAITWLANGVAAVGLDYRVADNQPWIPLVASTPAAAGTWPWVLPDAPTSAARVRVRDAAGGAADSSSAVFAILVPALVASPVPLDLPGPTPTGSEVCDTLVIQNPGTGLLTVSAVTSSNPAFRPGRTSFVVPAGGRDTLGVCFAPTVAGPDSAVFTLVADDPAGSHPVLVRGTGGSAVAAGEAPVVAFALESGQPNPFTRETLIRFALPRRSTIALDVYNLQGQRVATLAAGRREAGRYAVPFRPREIAAGRANVPSGVYFVRLRADGFDATRKLLYLGR